MKKIEEITIRQAAKYPNGKAASKWARVAPILQKAERGEELTAEELRTLAQAVNFTTHNPADKLGGFNSVSTAVHCNGGCKARAAIPGSICAHCYAATQTARQATLDDSLTINHAILTRVVIPPEIWREVHAYAEGSPLAAPSGCFRFESFGDLDASRAGVTQATNYINIARAFPSVHCAIWTKCPTVLVSAFEQVGKPDNLRAIYSSLYIDKISEIADGLRKWFDGRFTVWTDAKTCEAAGYAYNCPKRCRDCGKCYKADGWTEIHELKK